MTELEKELREFLNKEVTTSKLLGGYDEGEAGFYFLGQSVAFGRIIEWLDGTDDPRHRPRAR